MEADEEGELDGARVLELVHHRELEALAELGRDAWMLDDVERAIEEVDVVDDAPVFLPEAIPSEAHGGGLVEEPRELDELGLEARMGGVARRGATERLEGGVGRLRRFDGEHLRPRGPVEVVGHHRVMGGLDVRAHLRRLRRRIGRAREHRARCCELTTKRFVERIRVARLGENGGEPRDGAVRHRVKRVGRDAIRSREVHDVGHGRDPVGAFPLPAPAQLEKRREALDLRAHPRVERGLERLAEETTARVAHHVDLRRQPGVHGELLEQPQARGVHGPHVGEGQTERLVDGAFGDELLADARGELGVGLLRVRHREEALERDALRVCGLHGAGDDLRELEGLPAPRARGDDGDAGRRRHVPSQRRPQMAVWSQ